MSDAEKLIAVALKKRVKNGRHLHHRDCIHNLPPEVQVKLRGKTVEWWQEWIGPLPEQITPEQWETDGLPIGTCPTCGRCDYCCCCEDRGTKP